MVSADNTVVEIVNATIRPLLKLREFVAVDLNVGDVAPRIRQTLDTVEVDRRERMTLVVLISVVGLASLATFLYLVWRRR